MTYYNENDPKAAAWIRELMAANLITKGTVDERSITEVTPDDLAGFTRCHFFAGIAGWDYALHLAGWPATRPVWTASCPCQPFSSAGQGKGAGDDRHLWPVFYRLVTKLRPERVFGEQVAQAIGFNWLDGISADLETDGYTVGAAVLGAHSVGAPHIRQRLYWLANSKRSERREISRHRKDGRVGEGGGRQEAHSEPGACSEILRMADSNSGRCEQRDPSQRAIPIPAENSATGGIGDAAGGGCGIPWDEARQGSGRHAIGSSWARFEVVHCRDGKARRFEPGSFPLAHGVPGRVGLLRDYGNAIVPQVAAAFISASMEIIKELQ